MLNQLFIERYAHGRHQAHLSEAAHDRQQGEPRAAGQRAQTGTQIVVAWAATMSTVVISLITARLLVLA